MEPVEFKGYGDQPSSEDTLASSVSRPVGIGISHQAEIPELATDSERRELKNNPFHGYDCRIATGLALPVTWASTSEVDNKKVDSQIQMMSETDARGSNRDVQTQVNPIMQQRQTTPLTLLPYSPMVHWSDLEIDLFVLGLYIFGKDINLLSKFLGTKTIGDVLSFYYGKFRERNAYKRWKDCRKAKTKRCFLGKHIFRGPRMPELISRLKLKIPKEAHDSLVKVFKSFSQRQTSFEKFVFSLKSSVGTEAFVEAVGIGKGKDDLTGFVRDRSKFVRDRSKPRKPDLPTDKDYSSLGSEDIIKFLTGDMRRSKIRPNEFFWEAVWPRLLAKGWQSEHPEDVRLTKNCLVFLVPGIEKFCRCKLTKDTHYFDSVSDVIKRVTEDPALLDLKADGTENDFSAEKNVCITDMKLKQDSPSYEYKELPKFTIIDTTLVDGEEPFNVRELRNLPEDANITLVHSIHMANMESDSSLEEQDSEDGLSYDQGDSRRFSADIKDIEMAPAGSLKKKRTADGHSSNGSDDTRKYLLPVSKSRKLARCSDEPTSKTAVSSSKGVVLKKDKIKHLSTSSKSASAAGKHKTMENYSTNKERGRKQKMAAKNSFTTNAGSNERVRMLKLNERKPYGCKEDVVPQAHSKITVDETKIAKERSQVSAVINLNKQETPDVGMSSGKKHIMLSANHGGMNDDEAPSLQDCNRINDPWEETERRSASPQPEHANPRRHGTRNRCPTAKALEAIAYRLLGSRKRKGHLNKDDSDEPSISASSESQ